MKRKGICSVCGCTHDDPCDEGCAWANVKQTLCTACEPLNDAERKAKTAASLEILVLEHEQTEEYLSQLALRIEVLAPIKETPKKNGSPRRAPMARSGAD